MPEINRPPDLGGTPPDIPPQPEQQGECAVDQAMQAEMPGAYACTRPDCENPDATLLDSGLAYRDDAGNVVRPDIWPPYCADGKLRHLPVSPFLDVVTDQQTREALGHGLGLRIEEPEATLDITAPDTRRPAEEPVEPEPAADPVESTVVADQAEQQEATEQPTIGGIVEAFVPEGDVAFQWDPDVEVVYLQYERPGFEPSPESEYDPVIGGIGMTRRSLDAMDDFLPGIKQGVMNERGKIVFMGNGLSHAPLDALKDREEQPAAVVAVDAADYDSLHSDLSRLHGEMEAQLGETPWTVYDSLYRCETILDAASQDKIQVARCIVGVEPLPETVMDADLIINVYGPPIDTVQAQMEALKPGGRLFITSQHIPVHLYRGLGQVEAVYKQGSLRGFIITKPEHERD